MEKKTKLWSSLSVATLIGAGVLGGCDTGQQAAVPPGQQQPAQQQPAQQQQTEQPVEAPQPAADDHSAHQSGGGEGEGLATDVDPATDDAAFLTQLGLIRGHLWVGMELFRAGHLDQARTHAKHPEDELYADLKPAFAARGLEAIDAELGALAQAVDQGADGDTVEAAYEALLAALSRAEDATQASPAVWLQATVNLVRTAGVEYELAVDENGLVVNAHEYQDALGFVKIADQITARQQGDHGVEAAVAEIRPLIDALYPAWPELVPPEQVEFTPAQLYGAAARIELAVRELD